MNFKWVGPLALLAALVIGDQIRINRPGHKYRLMVRGGKRPKASNRPPASWPFIPTEVIAVGGHTLTRGDGRVH